MSQLQPEDAESGRWLDGLSVRVAIILTLALLPLGLLAVLQTQDLTREVHSRSELSLLTLTRDSATHQRQMIERSIGAAEALSPVLRMIRENTQACQTYLGDYLSSNQRYAYIGFLPVDGEIRCASDQAHPDIVDPRLFERLLENPQKFIAPVPIGSVADGAVFVVFNPVYTQNVLVGFTVITVLETDEPDQEIGPRQRPIGLLTFNAVGQILARKDYLTVAMPERPADADMADLSRAPLGTFFARNQNGERRLYVNVEIVPGIANALGVWSLENRITSRFALSVPTSLFPLLMWLASLAVAVFAVHRLAGRHLRKLSKEMRRFAIDRKIDPQILDRSTPQELRQLESSFQAMAYDLLNDEARMEDALREKNVLLKEVHHRVKNNLQMISSIMNMKIRKSEAPETKATIRRLQERVLSLATVHRNLYQSEDLSKTNAGKLLQELLGQIVASKKAEKSRNIRVDMDLDDVVMFPDQAVPFSLLTSEITNNAINHLDSPKGETPWIRVALKVEADTVRFECRNSVDPKGQADSEDDEQGLGAQLIRAFAIQLSATQEIDETDTEYTVTVCFTLQEFKPDVQDY